MMVLTQTFIEVLVLGLLIEGIICYAEDSILSHAVTGETREYCQHEAFEARCLKNEVIVMKNAILGRMKIGRCLDAFDVSSFGSGPNMLGCYVDVMHILDKRCSLMNHCEILIASNADLIKKKPCHPGLKNYLEAEFDCVTVIEEDRSCIVSVSANPLHIMHSSSTKHNCGTKHQPWVIEAPLGQNVNVNLLDLSYETGASEVNEQLQNCHQYGYIIDKSSKKNISLCGLTQERKKLIYKSLSNIIEVVLISPSNAGPNLSAVKVLLGFIAVGCSNIIPPEDTWLSRNDNEAVIGCYSSQQTWTLTCIDQQWIGVIGNCTRDVADFNEILKTSVQGNSEINYQVMVLVAVVFLGLIVCVTIIIIGAVCLKRYYTVAGHGEYCQKLEKNSTVWRASSQPGQNSSGVNTELLA